MNKQNCYSARKLKELSKELKFCEEILMNSFKCWETKHFRMKENKLLRGIIEEEKKSKVKDKVSVLFDASNKLRMLMCLSVMYVCVH